MISNRDSTSNNRNSSSQLAQEVQKKKKAMQAKAIAEEGDKEKKRMMIAYIGIGILAVLLVGFAIMKSSSTEETKETDFATPETNSDKYNTKLEALEAKQKRSNNSNLLDIFSNDKETDSIENDTLEEYKLKQNLQQLNKEPTKNPKTAKRVHSSKNTKKDVYGDYSMWEEEENKKNKTSKKRVNSNSKELTYEEKLKLAKEARYGTTSSNNQIKKETQQTRIAIFRDQFLLPGQLAELVLTKDFTYNNKLFKKGTPVYGYININKSRVLFDIKNIAHQPLNIEVRDIRDGLIGMYSNRAGELWKKYEAEGINDATDGVTSDLTSNGILSNSIDVVSKFFQKKRLNKNDYIMLLNDQELIVTIKNK